MKIGIIGFGNFGKLMAKHLKSKAEIFVTDIEDKTKEANKIGISFTSLDEVLKNKIIILAVPMEDLEPTLNKIKDNLQPNSLVLDVCSLKIFSTRLMKNILPKNIEIVGTHPLFGPQSIKDSIKGMRIVLTNVSAKKENFDNVTKFCQSLDLQTIISTPEEHDKQMAVSQALTHFIGQVSKKINLSRVEMSTKTFDDLMNVVDIIKNDTPKLFNNIQTMNPFAEEIREKFVQATNDLNEEIKKLKS